MQKPTNKNKWQRKKTTKKQKQSKTTIQKKVNINVHVLVSEVVSYTVVWFQVFLSYPNNLHTIA